MRVPTPATLLVVMFAVCVSAQSQAQDPIDTVLVAEMNIVSMVEGST